MQDSKMVLESFDDGKESDKDKLGQNDEFQIAADLKNHIIQDGVDIADVDR